MENKKVDTIDEYIAAWPLEIRKKLKQIRIVMKKSVPDAEERISYRMPMFYLNGVLVYFAAFKNHIGFFPTASGVKEFKDKLQDYKTTKGTIQFPYDKPIPLELVKKIVLFRAKENRDKRGIKKQKARGNRNE
jgi:uncharacterized protein YdhG (YjbR/CyaY superfamily)